MFKRSLYICELIQKQWNGQLTDREQAELDQFVRENPENRDLLKQFLNDEWIADELQKFTKYDMSESRGQLEHFLAHQTTRPGARQVPLVNLPLLRRMHFLPIIWMRYAAIVLVLLGTATYFVHTFSSKTKATATQPAPVPNDVLPGSDKATLTLSSGKQVELHSGSSETIADGGLAIRNSNGNLVYDKADVAVLNTVTTPRGGQYKLTLADGTKVWLNAASSITYPTSFNGKDRVVSITGEAYFEVVKNIMQPFTVKTYKDEITVLGTSFNVNSYGDEPILKTSLLSGSVRVGKEILKPGQAYFNGNITETDLEQDMAWKNGVFNFNKVSLPKAMRQIEKWYDVEIIYQGQIPKLDFYGEVQRSLNLHEVLSALSGLGVKFSLEKDRHLIVSKS